MIRVVVTGSECTGKTTLARALAKRYGVTWVPEFARLFVRQKGAPPVGDDVEAIARGQLELELGAEEEAKASPLLIQDTDLLSTVIYSHHYYGKCPGWIDETLRQRLADLYFLADIDVPWIADGQRDRGCRRDEMQELFRRALIDRNLRFAEICGSPRQRLRAATTMMDRLLSQARIPS